MNQADLLNDPRFINALAVDLPDGNFTLTYVERCDVHGLPAILITEIPDGFRIYKPNATYRIRTVESETLLRSIRHELGDLNGTIRVDYSEALKIAAGHAGLVAL